MSAPGLEGLNLLRSLVLTPEGLTRRVWEFGLVGQGPYARHVRLLPDGRVAGNLGENETFWRIENERVVFLTGADLRSTVFDRIYLEESGRLAMVGPFQAPRGLDHVLREVAPLDALAPASDAPEVIWRRKQAPRPNLVVLRANERSLHVDWPHEMLDSDRSWDLCVSFYGHEENFHADSWSEYRVLQNRTHKFDSLHALLHEESPFWGYEYVAFPDDDLMLSWRNWNELFAICRKYRLDLAQPALDLAGHIAHPITGRDDRFLLRYVSFVEVMTPIFSRQALRACAPNFGRSPSGFGLDNIWPKLLGNPRDRIAIIDQVPVLHTRPPGSQYNIDAAIAEGNAHQHAYDSPSHVLEFGGILADPSNRQHAW
ncbi:MAG: DUF707 domain-containing protein [Proteobacteria bacterium]|nr:DUF707 domain-containing protein [Pseudomonadota bacterium]